MAAINLGNPEPMTLGPRRKTRQIRVGRIGVGGESQVSVQSMTTTKTTDINGTLQQMLEARAPAGCDIVRVAVPTQDDADVLHIIAKKSQIPVIADIHFQPKYVFTAIEAGCAAIRVNPGNIRKFDDQVGAVARAASDAGVSLRIGVNAGSLDPRLLQKHRRRLPRHSSRAPCGRRASSRSTTSHDFSESRSSTTTLWSWSRPTVSLPSAATGRCTSV